MNAHAGLVAELRDNRLTLDTGAFRRIFEWNNGVLFENSDDEPNMQISGAGEAIDANFVVVDREETPIRERHLEATVHVTYDAIQVKRIFRLFANCPAISCEYYFKGSLPDKDALSDTDTAAARPNSARLLEDASLMVDVAGSRIRLDKISLPHNHFSIDATRFLDVTDRNNNLVHTTRIYPYRSAFPVAANLITAEDLLDEGGTFILKEAPGPVAHIAYPGYDYLVKGSTIEIDGAGFEYSDLSNDEWLRGYGVVVGSYGATGAAQALHDYQNRLRRRDEKRDDMILMNTWGDRGQDTRIGESFALAELEAGAHLGITHFQLDDGWQSGRTSNSATTGGSLDSIWNSDDFWTPHPDRFPNGLGPVVAKSKEVGIELCVWFNPSADDSYAHWMDDAQVLINLYKTHSIRTFKIDGVKIEDKTAEINLRRMLDLVMDETKGTAVFNLDVTAGRRFGYFTFREYGNLFLENRYTDTGSYYPHWTLRNLWALSSYVPPQSLQIEFLNKWRNADKYPTNDPLAPDNVPFEYCFAVTMAAQPLAWFEGTGLPEEAFGIRETISAYREHQHKIHSGNILPIGNEPTGTGWTGFQSIIDATSGYILVFREHNDISSARIQLQDVPNTCLELHRVCGQGSQTVIEVDGDGNGEFELPGRFNFALYRYAMAGSSCS